MIAKPVFVEPMDNYAIFLRYDDGTQGTVDLKHLAHQGVFRQWDNDNFFSHVHIDTSGAIAWNEEIDLCPDSLYLRLRKMDFEIAPLS